MIFCPACGASSESDNVYCKRCGQLLPGSQNRQLKNSFLLLPYLSALCALLAAVSFIALLVAFPNDSGGWAVAIAGISCFLIAVYQLLTFVMSLRLRRRFLKGRGEAIDLTEEPGTEKVERLLDAGDSTEFVRAHSVTENTTELLEPVARKQGNE
jgi:predicted nucleic acid-binding Zn ribbon protein